MEKNKNLMMLQLLGGKKANQMGDMAEIVFFGGGRKKGEGYVKYNSLFQQENVNPSEICNY